MYINAATERVWAGPAIRDKEGSYFAPAQDGGGKIARRFLPLIPAGSASSLFDMQSRQREKVFFEAVPIHHGARQGKKEERKRKSEKGVVCLCQESEPSLVFLFFCRLDTQQALQRCCFTFCSMIGEERSTHSGHGQIDF